MANRPNYESSFQIWEIWNNKTILFEWFEKGTSIVGFVGFLIYFVWVSYLCHTMRGWLCCRPPRHAPPLSRMWRNMQVIRKRKRKSFDIVSNRHLQLVALPNLLSIRSTNFLLARAATGLERICFDFRLVWKHTLLTRGFIHFRTRRVSGASKKVMNLVSNRQSLPTQSLP